MTLLLIHCCIFTRLPALAIGLFIAAFTLGALVSGAWLRRFSPRATAACAALLVPCIALATLLAGDERRRAPRALLMCSFAAGGLGEAR
jgi:MFS family permease